MVLLYKQERLVQELWAKHGTKKKYEIPNQEDGQCRWWNRFGGETDNSCACFVAGEIQPELYKQSSVDKPCQEREPETAGSLHFSLTYSHEVRHVQHHVSRETLNLLNWSRFYNNIEPKKRRMLTTLQLHSFCLLLFHLTFHCGSWVASSCWQSVFIHLEPTRYLAK